MPQPSTSPASAAAPSAATRRKPELLSPAGDWDCVHAAVENGADAIYFGLDRFNARMRAKNFTAADLPSLMEFLHRRGVRGYLTFNTLVFTPELADAEDYLRTIIGAGADAAIVQDVGIMRLIRALSPDFPIHCSTQMTVTSDAGVEFARRLGANLVVLARENNLADIESVQRAQGALGDAGIQASDTALPLEVFVHGALCVAYSGQCLTSESLGGRSANRGECAQACRLPYELVSDGALVDLGDRKYLLSPQDLSAVDVIPDLVRLGVASFKIEGRLKSPEYVASITRVYRSALDRAWAAIAPVDTPPAQPTRSGDPAYELQMSFSRGLFTGWFRGTDNRSLVHARFGTKRGVFLGEVDRVDRDCVVARLSAPLKPGDGIVFDAGTPEKGEQGGRVYQVEPHGRETVLRFGRGDVDFTRIHPGNLLWKTSDPALERELRATYEGDRVRYQRPLHFDAHGAAGTPLTVFARDNEGAIAQAVSTVSLAPASNRPLTAQQLETQLGRLGGTPFALGRLDSHVEPGLMLPVSELNRLRRELVAELERQRSAPRHWTLRPGAAAPFSTPAPERTARDAAELIALVRHSHQIDAAWAAGVRTVYCEFENPKHYREAVNRFRALQGSGPSDGSAIWVAAPRVFKPGEDWILRQVLSSEADGYLIRNYDHLRFFQGVRRRGDYPLNIANPLSARLYIEEHGLERVTASYDLNVAQLEALLGAAPGAWFDITLHQHMPMFHMEHCVFCAFLSSGKDYHDCGRPCEKHRVELRDRVGALLPLKADAGCRNTVFNNRAQTGAEFLPRFLALGARSFRVEFVDEPADEVRRTLERYRQLLSGEISGADLWRELRLINQLGVTRGQLEAAPQVLSRKA